MTGTAGTIGRCMCTHSAFELTNPCSVGGLSSPILRDFWRLGGCLAEFLATQNVVVGEHAAIWRQLGVIETATSCCVGGVYVPPWRAFGGNLAQFDTTTCSGCPATTVQIFSLFPTASAELE
jgi:hypothetical protein